MRFAGGAEFRPSKPVTQRQLEWFDRQDLQVSLSIADNGLERIRKTPPESDPPVATRLIFWSFHRQVHRRKSARAKAANQYRQATISIKMCPRHADAPRHRQSTQKRVAYGRTEIE